MPAGHDQEGWTSPEKLDDLVRRSNVLSRFTSEEGKSELLGGCCFMR